MEGHEGAETKNMASKRHLLGIVKNKGQCTKLNVNIRGNAIAAEACGETLEHI